MSSARSPCGWTGKRTAGGLEQRRGCSGSASLPTRATRVSRQRSPNLSPYAASSTRRVPARSGPVAGSRRRGSPRPCRANLHAPRSRRPRLRRGGAGRLPARHRDGREVPGGVRGTRQAPAQHGAAARSAGIARARSATRCGSPELDLDLATVYLELKQHASARRLLRPLAAYPHSEKIAEEARRLLGASDP